MGGLKEFEENRFHFGVEQGDVEDNVVAGGDEPSERHKEHDGAEFIGHFAEIFGAVVV